MWQDLETQCHSQICFLSTILLGYLYSILTKRFLIHSPSPCLTTQCFPVTTSMTISASPSPYNGSLTVQFSNEVEFKLYPWFDEAFTAHANLNYPLFGISSPMRQLFPGYSSGSADESSNVFAATLEFSGPDDGVPKEMCLKLARGIDEVVHLSHEASFYRNELAKLTGITVPRMYGFFSGHHDDAPVGCLLLELCTGPKVLRYDTDEFMYVPFACLFPFFPPLSCY
jgi:hypothetical protein